MATGPNTLAILQAMQLIVFNEVLISNASPFTPWSSNGNPQNPSGNSDLTRFGGNPFPSPSGTTISTAIYIGAPKDPDTAYPKQCQIIPPPSEMAYRATFGGKVWHERWVYVRFLYQNINSWYENQQALMQVADVAHTVMQKHAELPNDTAVMATKEVASHSGLPTGYHRIDLVGTEWDAWGLIWWAKEEYGISGGFVS